MRPKQGHRIPKEANLTEWERNPESHVFVDWHLALGVEYYIGLRLGKFLPSDEKITQIHMIHNNLSQFVCGE